MRSVEPPSDGLSSQSLQQSLEDTASRHGRVILRRGRGRGRRDPRAESESSIQQAERHVQARTDRSRACRRRVPAVRRQWLDGSRSLAVRCGAAQQPGRCRAATVCQSTGERTRSQTMLCAPFANADRGPVRDGRLYTVLTPSWLPSSPASSGCRPTRRRQSHVTGRPAPPPQSGCD